MQTFKTHRIYVYVGHTITLVHYDLTADLSLKSVSAQLNVNPNYFIRLFKRQTGITPKAYREQQQKVVID